MIIFLLILISATIASSKSSAKSAKKHPNSHYSIDVNLVTLTSEWRLEQVLVEGRVVDCKQEHLAAIFFLVSGLVVHVQLQARPINVLNQYDREQTCHSIARFRLALPNFLVVDFGSELLSLAIVLKVKHVLFPPGHELIDGLELLLGGNGHTVVDPVYLGLLPLRLGLLRQLFEGFGGDDERQLFRIIIVADCHCSVNLIFLLIQCERDWLILEPGNIGISAYSRKRRIRRPFTTLTSV